MNEQIVKLNKHIANAWQSVENAVKNRNRAASQDALNKLANLENLKSQQIALEQNIEASISAEHPKEVNGHPNGSAHQSSAQPVYFQSRRKRSTIRPQEIRIGTFRKPINIANQIPITTANWLIEQGKTLPTIPNFIHPTNSGFSQSAAPRQLINGSFIEIGDNQEILMQKARRLLDACGFRSLKIEILFENGTTKFC
ncbi:MAG TPA: hypothetical protein VHG89_12590 [Verrucomicrobiae bacterium]|nr:hypothetical protein [Verrucomicrobiae bacterium]